MTSEWQWLTLSDVLVPQGNRKPLQQGWSPRCHPHPAESGKWGVLKTTAVQAGSYEPTHNKELPETLDPRPQFEVRAGDLLMTCAGPRARCGVPTLVRHTPERLMMSGKMYRFRPDERLDPRFLELWLLSAAAQKRIDAMKTGISDSGLNLTHDRFVQLPVPVPSLDEQRRIVDLLEDHLTRLDAAERDVRAARAKQELVWLSTLSSLRRDLASERHARITDVADTSLGKMLDAKKQSGSPTPYLRNINLRWGSFDLSNVQLTPLTEAEVTRFDVRSGDVMVCEGGEPGRCAVWRKSVEGIAFQKALHRIRVHSTSEVLPEFLALMLTEAIRSGRCDHLFTGTTIKHLPQEKLRTIEIAIPSIDGQRAALTQADDVATSQTRLGAALDHAGLRASSLRRSLLAAAFSGRLTGAASDVIGTQVIEELAGV